MAGSEAAYVYGVVRGSATPPAGGGVDEQAVRLAGNGELAALVSTAPSVPVKASRRNLMAHSRVLKEARAARRGHLLRADPARGAGGRRGGRQARADRGACGLRARAAGGGGPAGRARRRSGPRERGVPRRARPAAGLRRRSGPARRGLGFARAREVRRAAARLPLRRPGGRSVGLITGL